MEISQFQHPDSIWTWKNIRGGRAALWIPYLNSIEPIQKSKARYKFVYKGGEVVCALKDIDFIMIYGGDAALSVGFLDDIGTHGVVLAIHRRNMPRPLYLLPHTESDDTDILSAQILVRENLTRRCYVARTIIAQRIASFSWRIPIPGAVFKKLREARTLKSIRSIEAEWTKRYWDAFYSNLSIDTTRRETHQVNSALDAGSKFLSGILLRWALFHKLSPTHGFLHEQTTYISLIYDLIEPYRIWIERAVDMAFQQTSNEDMLVATTISILKEMLLEDVYLPAFQKSARRKNVLHAEVLALRSYLAKETARLVIPVEGERIGGRPVKAGFAIPGAKK